MTAPEIRQNLDLSLLEILSDEALDAADDVGELDGNQHYSDLSIATWDDVRFALEREASLIEEIARALDPAAAEQTALEARDDDDEREALWHLDIGVAAAVVALNALGAHTVLSCNGGAFGGSHLRDFPSIRFCPRRVRVEVLLELARDSDVGLDVEEHRALLYGRSIEDMQRFAALALERFGRDQIQE
ncbi:MAG: hypothetical protein JSR45_17905 [Proteobacteria bacterium]|nr:hypothetical protein [Pseudomonadota bacterium]